MTQSPPAGLDLTWPPPPYGQPVPATVSEDGVRHFDGVTYATTPGYRPRLLDVHVPQAAGPLPTVIWIHGGGWLDGDRRYPPPTVPAELLHGAILGAGFALVSIDYRHSMEAPFPAQLHDVKAAIRYVRHFADAFGIDPERIGVWGESAGGHLAALAGVVGPDSPGGPALEGTDGVATGSTSVSAVVDWYGVHELVALLSHPMPIPPGSSFPNPFATLLGGTPEEWPELARIASPTTYAHGPDIPPFLLVHGTVDGLVPYSQSEVFAQALEEAGGEVTLEPVEGADHIFLGSADIPSIVARGVAFLARHLGA
ncbi:alpha/beta hydrolase [Streptomyces sp. NBC_00083]|uniref:alpha/beta hydrolase n=1 Tax=Streptomyces sp. NBC_00083 TaxID=2975647 RepID=UPI00224DB9EA|nr:alpha/beta hydrolase [Streptomyces sp. NBC_00083]MCX5384392.1 alpha/beta hydrolase [Streptomyces sp. NBC_00083]